jgi:hypothetical protein
MIARLIAIFLQRLDGNQMPTSNAQYTSKMGQQKSLCHKKKFTQVCRYISTISHKSSMPKEKDTSFH